jgi:NADH-quinone oxidoreductase subunit B
MSLINTFRDGALTTRRTSSSTDAQVLGVVDALRPRLRAIELMQTQGPRADVDRFGAAPRASPRQSDLMVVAGTLTMKMALRTKVLYEQMPEPRYATCGACASCGGLFQLAYSFATGQGHSGRRLRAAGPRGRKARDRGILKLQENDDGELAGAPRRGGAAAAAVRVRSTSIDDRERNLRALERRFGERVISAQLDARSVDSRRAAAIAEICAFARDDGAAL